MKRGLLVVFIGVDGSGKSTLANRTVTELEREGFDAVCIMPFEYILLSPIIALFKKKAGNGSDKRATRNPLLNEGKKNPLFQLWPFLALVDNWVYYLFRILPLLRKKQIIVCDRYFYDFVTSFEHFGFSRRSVSLIYRNLLPKPDLTFVLDVTPEVAKRREKGDCHSLPFFRAQRARYLYYFHPNQRMVRLSIMGAPITETMDRILHLVSRNAVTPVF